MCRVCQNLWTQAQAQAGTAWPVFCPLFLWAPVISKAGFQFSIPDKLCLNCLFD